MASAFSNTLIKRLASNTSMLKRLLSTNQTNKIVVRDQRNATISIKVYDAAGKIRVFIGKREQNV